MKTILLADDDRAFCSALGNALRRRGLKVILAHNLAEATSEATAWQPDLALIDLQMGESNGLEVLTALRRLQPKLKCVVLTGYGSIDTAVEAIKLGAVHYLTKPAEVEEVLAAFDKSVSPQAEPETTEIKPLGEVEWAYLQQVLHTCDGNISEAARRLGMHRRSLQRKLARGPNSKSADDKE